MKWRSFATWSAVILLVLADVAFWWLSQNGEPAQRPAFVTAASGVAVAIVGVGSTLLAAARAHTYTIRATLKAERREIYARALSHVEHNRSVRSRQKICQEAYDDSNGDPTAGSALNRATEEVNAWNAEFDRVEARFSLVAPEPVQEALTALHEKVPSDSDTDDEGYSRARTAFIAAAKADLSD